MCLFHFEVTVCRCPHYDRCLGAERYKQANINGDLYHVLSEPIAKSQICLRQRLKKRGASASRSCVQTPMQSRLGSAYDKTVFVFADSLCSDCAMCSNWI